MKKRICTLAAILLLAMTSAVFAQELRLGGYLNTGIGIVTDDRDETEARIKAHAVDAGHQGYRFRLNGSYTNEAKNAGVNFRLQSQNALTLANASVNADTGAVTNSTVTEFLSLPYAFGWVSFLDNKINLSGGIIEDSTWTTGDFWLASDSVSAYAGLGTLLKVTPVEGFILGLGIQTIGRRGGGNNNTLAKSNFASSIDLDDARINVHAGYTMKDVFRAGLSYRTESKIGADESSRMFAEFRYLGMKDLGAIVAVSVNNLGDDFDTIGQIVLSETFSYKIDNINFGLNAVQFLYNTDNWDPGLFFNLWGSYTMDNVIPRLDLVYFMAGSSLINGTTDQWFRGAYGPTGNDDLSVLTVRPSVRINLDSRTHFEIGDMLNFDFNDSDSVMSNVFYIDFRWNF